MLNCFKYFAIYILKHFVSKIWPNKSWNISNLYMLNCFKYFLIYILEQNVSKSDKKDFELYQVLMCWIVLNIFWYMLWGKMSQNQARKISLIFWHAKIPSSFRMPHYWHKFFPYLFFNCFAFLSLPCQTKRLIRIIRIIV